ncbi:MAG: nucleotidyl transferase AbiEii/AbiGii toxin family protein [bacterium]
MSIKTILSKNQRNILEILSKEPDIYNNFCLTGGTALSEYYLLHRYSEDLDFFSEQEFDIQGVIVLLKKIKKQAKIKKIELQQSFNRNLVFLQLANDLIKTEFTYFPFSKIETGAKVNKLSIESLADIAVNKIFTIYQNPRSRDFIDLYLINQQKGWSIDELVGKAKIKFDWHIEPIQLGAQFLQAEILKDYPKMIKKIKHSEWIEYFKNEAKNLKKSIVR